MDIHGLILLGSDPVYAVHMPLFTPPYDVQAMARVTLSTDTYQRARARYGTSALFTVRPQGPAAGADIPGELFFGPFASDGDPLGEVTVRVRQRVWAHRLEPDPAPQPTLEYVLFGTDEVFLAHRLTGPPDFDQLLTAQFTGEPAEQGTTVRLPGRPNDLTGRLRPGEQITTTEGAGLQVLAEVYLETRD
ncbi:hypothetical protein AQI88_33625 [Streptomyces cellostaticus]|uniref:Uncharacterized protein n=1 Tax=Streptomyces cellostaticus TaxID=67285 RepID=A0A101NF61_9ACTN|nr:hypothetical protein [Streptomyces cellostaticus]KUM92124.1 hypothetical protein AQI88_33625 [Streptomyces cellostaticus]GHI07929.1 hypothetical protein Scel_62500 [Streptomyces cellostaticus]